MLPRQTHAVQWVLAANGAKGRSHGFELAATWRVQPQFRLDFTLAQVRTHFMELPGHGTTDREGSAPERQWGLRAAWAPRADLDFNLQWRRVGRLDEPAIGMAIPTYSELDLRLAWRPMPALELALVGRNLLDSRHAESTSELLDLPQMQIQRALMAQLSWKF
jgi:iron complex outermembrane receptor protein